MAASMVGRRGGLAVTGYRGRLRSERGLRTGRTVVAQWGEYSAPRPCRRRGAGSGRGGPRYARRMCSIECSTNVARFSAEANRLLERRIFAHSAVRMRVRVLGHVRVCTDFVSSIVGGRPAPAGTLTRCACLRSPYHCALNRCTMAVKNLARTYASRSPRSVELLPGLTSNARRGARPEAERSTALPRPLHPRYTAGQRGTRREVA